MLWDLVKLELLKILVSKRLVLVFLLLLVLAIGAVFSDFANRNKALDSQMSAIKEAQLQIANLESIPSRDSYQEQKLAEMKQELVMYTEEKLPIRYTSAFQFTVEFLAQGSKMYLALLIFLVTGDLISSEFATGMIRLVYSSPTRRYKFLVGKIITGSAYVSFLVILSTLIFLIVGGVAYGFQGWNLPVQEYPRLPGFNYLSLLLMQMFLTITTLQVVMLMGVAFSTTIRNSMISLALSSSIVFATIYAYAEEVARPVAKYLFWFHLSLIDHFSELGLTFLITRQFRSEEGIRFDSIESPPVGIDFSIEILLAYSLLFAIVSILVLSRSKAPA